MMPFDAGIASVPVDSARVVSHVYSASLLTVVPLIGAAAAAILVRRASAGVRALVWRAAVVAVLGVYLAQMLPSGWRAGIVPAPLAQPLVALGRLMVISGSPLDGAAVSHRTADLLFFAKVVAALYLLGCALALVPLLRGFSVTRRLTRDSCVVTDPVLVGALAAARKELGLGREVTLLAHPSIAVPLTFGVLRPRILLPAGAEAWDPVHLRAALLHELAHVQAGDVAYAVAARVAGALFWFHPGIWWIGRRLHRECEIAADDRVLSAGVRPSDYGTLLLAVAHRMRSAPRPACALAAAGGLRLRMGLVLQSGRDLGVPTGFAARMVLHASLAGAAALGATELTPTRGVLQGLMRDPRWESRAYAVVGLAARPDSVIVARAAAATDPSPRVRALANRALSRSGYARPLSTELHNPNH